MMLAELWMLTEAPEKRELNGETRSCEVRIVVEKVTQCEVVTETRNSKQDTVSDLRPIHRVLARVIIRGHFALRHKNSINLSAH